MAFTGFEFEAENRQIEWCGRVQKKILPVYLQAIGRPLGYSSIRPDLETEYSTNYKSKILLIYRPSLYLCLSEVLVISKLHSTWTLREYSNFSLNFYAIT